MSVFKGFIFSPGDICTDPKAVIYIFKHSLSHTCTHRDGPKYTYLQRIPNVEVCFHCSVWRRQREDPALFGLGTYNVYI